LRHLLRGQIGLHVLRVCVQQQKQAFSNGPVVNDAGASAFAARPDRYANLAYSATTLDESAETWIRRQPGLKRPIVFIAEQSSDLPRKGGSFDQLHVLQLSAIGG
jgi:hypothetical protein